MITATHFLPLAVPVSGRACCAAITLLRDVAGATVAPREPGEERSLTDGFVFTVDNVLKMLGIALRLQVGRGRICAPSGHSWLPVRPGKACALGYRVRALVGGVFLGGGNRASAVVGRTSVGPSLRAASSTRHRGRGDSEEWGLCAWNMRWCDGIQVVRYWEKPRSMMDELLLRSAACVIEVAGTKRTSQISP